MQPQVTATGTSSIQNLNRWNEVNSKVLNGNVSYGSTMSNQDPSQNLHVWKADGTTPGSPNTEFAINYQLDHKPLTIVGQDTNNGGVIYRSSTPWTFNQQKQSGTIYLKCTTAAAAYNLIVG